MAIQREIWADEIVGGLFAPNQFASYALDATPWVVNGTQFHIPQAGAPTGVVENATVFPIAVEERTDTDLAFGADNFFVKPVRVGDAEQYELSYSKLQSVTQENRLGLLDRVSMKIAFRWATASAGGSIATILKTTGAARAGSLSYAVGTRKAITKDDFQRAAQQFDDWNLPEQGRMVVLPPRMYYDLFGDNVLLNRDAAQDLDLQKGIIRELFGFNIMKRSGLLRYTNAATPVARDTTANGAATDCGAALFWHPSLVYVGQGETKIFANEGDATMYGDVISMLVRVGAAKKRADGKGVLVMTEEFVS